MTTRPSPLESVDPFRVSGRSRLVDEVTSRLRELILSHQLTAGAKLVQTELAERLGVSRTPLREAIRLLEHDGLVRVSNGNGTVEVAKLAGEELTELYEIREIVDGLAARLLARRGLSDDADATISDALARMKQAVYPMKGDPFFVAHLDFHSGIVEHCGNGQLRGQLPLVRRTAASLRDEFPRRVRKGPKISETAAKKYAAMAIAEHREIYEAIRSGDEAAAETVARHHIRHSLDMYVHPHANGTA